MSCPFKKGRRKDFECFHHNELINELSVVVPACSSSATEEA
jgi:hypothetical protein